MVRAAVAHLVKILTLALRTNFEKLPLEILSIDYMYGIGLFNNRDILSIVIRTIKQRNEHTNPIASRIFHRYRK